MKQPSGHGVVGTELRSRDWRVNSLGTSLPAPAWVWSSGKGSRLETEVWELLPSMQMKSTRPLSSVQWREPQQPGPERGDDQDEAA